MLLKKFRFKAPYKANGKTNFPDTRKRTGVYIIKKNDVIVYVGYSESQLYKTLYRHFQAWNDKGQPGRISYQSALKRNKFLVRVVYCSSKRAAALEKALILKHKPKDNKQKYASYLEEAAPKEVKYIKNVGELYSHATVLNEAPF